MNFKAPATACKHYECERQLSLCLSERVEKGENPIIPIFYQVEVEEFIVKSCYLRLTQLTHLPVTF